MSLHSYGPRLSKPPTVVPHNIFELFEELANGIPKRFPTDHCALTLPWSSIATAIMPSDPYGGRESGQNVQAILCGIEVSRRVDENWLTASLPLVSAGECMPQPDQRLSEIVRSLGMERWTKNRCLLTQREHKDAQSARKATEPIIATINKLSNAQIVAAPRPDDVPPKSFTTPFRKIAEDLGFVHRKDLSEPKSHIAHKVSRQGSVYELVLDVAGLGPPWSPLIDLHIKSFGKYEVSVNVLPQRRIEGRHQWELVCSQTRTWIADIERTYLPSVEQVLGHSPTWFAEFSRIVTSRAS